MKYLILHAHGENGLIYITGCFGRVNKGSPERKKFEELVNDIENLNKEMFMMKNVVIMEGTVYFKRIEITRMIKALEIWSQYVIPNLEISVGRNIAFTGDVSGEKFEKELSKSFIPVTYKYKRWRANES